MPVLPVLVGSQCQPAPYWSPTCWQPTGTPTPGTTPRTSYPSGSWPRGPPPVPSCPLAAGPDPAQGRGWHGPSSSSSWAGSCGNSGWSPPQQGRGCPGWGGQGAPSCDPPLSASACCPACRLPKRTWGDPENRSRNPKTPHGRMTHGPPRPFTGQETPKTLLETTKIPQEPPRPFRDPFHGPADPQEPSGPGPPRSLPGSSPWAKRPPGPLQNSPKTTKDPQVPSIPAVPL
ncbi:hypothetical protein llap_21138 [Limosa lapponica baueri]|uniref:Uncharacterized protein n=1 Tax=Limosa lapponica baueri TaxID=1758121 RepID=A0A2I0T450_LIMLA|nr:hypothetical protein llap_21138 [Limosa lapponica baueri]